jgi:hypothetical protein
MQNAGVPRRLIPPLRAAHAEGDSLPMDKSRIKKQQRIFFLWRN